MKRLLLLPLLLASLAALASCSTSEGGSLQITSSDGGADITTIDIACDTACEEALGKIDLAPVPADAACTRIYGGPEEIALRGEVGGRQILTSFNKRGGCEMARWETLQTFLEEMNVSYEELFPSPMV